MASTGSEYVSLRNERSLHMLLMMWRFRQCWCWRMGRPLVPPLLAIYVLMMPSATATTLPSPIWCWQCSSGMHRSRPDLVQMLFTAESSALLKKNYALDWGNNTGGVSSYVSNNEFQPNFVAGGAGSIAWTYLWATPPTCSMRLPWSAWGSTSRSCWRPRWQCQTHRCQSWP